MNDRGLTDWIGVDIKSLAECSVFECERLSKALGYCPTHWKQVQVYGIEPRPIRRWNKNPVVCIFAGCNNGAAKLSLCLPHYGQDRMGNLGSARYRGKITKRSCVIAGCESVITRSKLLCQRHDNVAGTYKLTSVQLQMLFDRGCEICSSTIDLHIDHDHSCCDRKVTGKKTTCGNCVRGVLCRFCNNGLGFFNDDISKMSKAIAYLSR